VGSPIGTSSDRPINVERIRRSWEAGECAARGPAPTGSGSPIVGVGLVAGRRRKRRKQIPPDRTQDSCRLSGARRYARNDNLGAFGKVANAMVSKLVEMTSVGGRVPAGVEVGVMRAVRVWGRAESGSRSYL
jgi:hypothetical protein